MSETTDPTTPTLPTSEATPGAAAPAPARRRRSPKPDAEAAVAVDGAGGSEAVTSTDAAPKRRRRKPADEAAAGSADGVDAAAVQMPLALDPSDVAAEDRPARPPRRRRAPADEGAAEPTGRGLESPAVVAAATPERNDGPLADVAQPQDPTKVAAHEAVLPRADAVRAERDGDADERAVADGGAEPAGGEGGAPSSEGGERSSRRRNRRDRKRGPRPDGAAPTAGAAAAVHADGGEASDEDGEAAAPASPRAAPITVGELFAQVLGGSFDVECEPTAEEAQQPHKRVLAPEPDAPKLHKVLAQAGVGSRRDMEQMILDGRIAVNGQSAHVGQRISFGDQVKVDGKPVRFRIAPPAPRIIAYHKPVGEVVTVHDPENRPTVFRKLPRLPQGKWQSVGRLDINTEGLLLFTNSGDLANQLMHPRFGIEREYAVRVLGELDEYHREELLEGVEVEGQEAKFLSIEDGGGEGANHWYRVVIAEGRNREVRKLFDAVGLTVSRLIRIRYGNVVLPRGLKRGVWMDLDDQDVKAIRRLAGGDLQPQARPNNGGGGKPNLRNDRGPNGKRPNQNNRNQPRGNQNGPRPPRDDRDDFDHGPIPNPLEQTFDKRFVQKPRPLGGFGNAFGGGGFGPGGSAPPRDNQGQRKGGPKQPDPMQTSVGYIGADAFHRKGGRGGNRGGGGGGGFGGGGFGGGRRGR